MVTASAALSAMEQSRVWYGMHAITHPRLPVTVSVSMEWCEMEPVVDDGRVDAVDEEVVLSSDDALSLLHDTRLLHRFKCK